MWNLEGGNVVLQQLIDIYRERYIYTHALSQIYIYLAASPVWGFCFLDFSEKQKQLQRGDLNRSRGDI